MVCFGYIVDAQSIYAEHPKASQECPSGAERRLECRFWTDMMLKTEEDEIMNRDLHVIATSGIAYFSVYFSLGGGGMWGKRCIFVGNVV